MSTMRRVEQRETSGNEDTECPERGLTWWSHAACGALLATILIPLLFDSMKMTFLAVAGGAAATGLALAMSAATIAYFTSGKSWRIMNITLTAAALTLMAVCIGVVTIAHAAAVQRETERLSKGIDDALRVVTLQWMQELERSGSARWTRTGASAGEILTQALSEGGNSPAAKLLRGCEPVIREITANASRHEEAVLALHNSGGLSASGLKSKADCDTRMAHLKAMGDASSTQLEALRSFYERISAELVRVDLDSNTKGQFITRAQSDPKLAAAMLLRDLDMQYAKCASAYVAFLKAGSGKWSLVTKDNTVYLGQGMNSGEFNRLSRTVNEISDREIALQEQELKSAAKKTSPKGTRPDGLNAGPGK